MKKYLLILSLFFLINSVNAENMNYSEKWADYCKAEIKSDRHQAILNCEKVYTDCLIEFNGEYEHCFINAPIGLRALSKDNIIKADDWININEAYGR